MGYINSVAYVQYNIDNILCDIQAWTQAYIDNTVCSAKLLPDLLQKLRILFDIFFKYNISIKLTKFYLNYLDIGLLGQLVNFLGLTTSEEKFRAIRLLTYPTTLKALEYYLIFTGYLRTYIHFCAQLAVPLQALKTSLLQDAPVRGQQQRAYASRTNLGPPTAQKLVFFQRVQDALSQSSTLIHHSSDKKLWIDLDTSKEFGLEVVVFYTATNNNLPERRWPNSILVQLILFLSKLLTLAEKNYWLTELEIASFV